MQSPLSKLDSLSKFRATTKKIIEYQNSDKNHFQNHISNATQICEEKQKKEGNRINK